MFSCCFIKRRNILHHVSFADISQKYSLGHHWVNYFLQIIPFSTRLFNKLSWSKIMHYVLNGYNLWYEICKVFLFLLFFFLRPLRTEENTTCTVIHFQNAQDMQRWYANILKRTARQLKWTKIYSIIWSLLLLGLQWVMCWQCNVCCGFVLWITFLFFTFS